MARYLSGAAIALLLRICRSFAPAFDIGSDRAAMVFVAGGVLVSEEGRMLSVTIRMFRRGVLYALTASWQGFRESVREATVMIALSERDRGKARLTALPRSAFVSRPRAESSESHRCDAAVVAVLLRRSATVSGAFVTAGGPPSWIFWVFVVRGSVALALGVALLLSGDMVSNLGTSLPCTGSSAPC